MTKTIQFFICLLLLLPVSLMGQSAEVEMADTMRSEGKIYVVVAVLLLIFGGLIAYLIMLDRKIGKLEKKLPPDSNL